MPVTRVHWKLGLPMEPPIPQLAHDQVQIHLPLKNKPVAAMLNEHWSGYESGAFTLPT